MSALDVLQRKLDRLVERQSAGEIAPPEHARERRQLERAIDREQARSKSKAKAARHSGPSAGA
jgi:hypothetical protein